MKLIIDIPEEVVAAIQNGEDYRYDIHTTIAQGKPFFPFSEEVFYKITDAEWEHSDSFWVTTPSGKKIEFEKKRPQSKWIHRRIIAKNRSFDVVVCSNCQTEFSWDAETGVSMDNYKTCPNCGADMKGGAE